MEYTLLANNLAGLLVFTSLFLVICKKTSTSILIYIVQAVVLVLVFFTLAKITDAEELFTWGMSATITKVILLPFILSRMLKNITDESANGTIISSGLVITLCSIITLVCYLIAHSINIPEVTSRNLQPILGISLGHFMIGVLCIIVQRNIVKQIFGYCLMENGSHLTLALIANQAPHLVEIGVTTDALFAVIVMGYMVRRIYHTMHTLKVQDLTALKG